VAASGLKFSLNGGSLPTACFVYNWLAAIHINVLVFSSPLISLTLSLAYNISHGRRIKHRFSVARVSVEAGTCLPSRSLAVVVYSCSLRICCLSTDVVPLIVLQSLPRNKCSFRAIRRQRLFPFLWLHRYCFEQIGHNAYIRNDETFRWILSRCNASFVWLYFVSTFLSQAPHLTNNQLQHPGFKVFVSEAVNAV
jgi:hypothetical protein